MNYQLVYSRFGKIDALASLHADRADKVVLWHEGEGSQARWRTGKKAKKKEGNGGWQT